MKKILTLAIALVMVFAIAAPAFAAGWDNPVDPEEFENLALDITALSVDYYTGAWNGSYQKLDATYPVVAGTKVHAYAEVTIPKEADLSDDIATRIEAGKGQFKLTFSNLKVDSITYRCDGVEYAPAANQTKIPLDKNNFGMTITAEIWGTVEKSDKDAKITATLGVYNRFGDFVEDPTQFRFYAKDGKEYIIRMATAHEYVVTPKSDVSSGMTFFTNSNDQLEMAKVWLKGTPYTIVDSFGEVRFINDTTNTTATGETLTKVQAMMDQICNAMGFTYSGRAYMNKTLIEENLGTVVEGKDSLVYPTGYVQQLVTNDPSVKPPQTGDNASVVGFVMIAVALVAAAAVTVKKVRA